MLRIAFVDVVMFSLPFLIYGAYVLVARGGQTTGVGQGAPLLWLAAAGSILLVVTMALLISFSGGGPSGSYHPPSFSNGVITPGKVD